MNKQFVPLQQALSYLQFLSSDTQAFTDKMFKPPPPQTDKQQKKATPRDKLKKYNQQTQIKRPPMQSIAGSQNQGKKNLNKNRAIKRIIDTSKQILQASNKYQQPIQNQQKSYVTQFNIYLKQYNRLCQQILAQQHEKQQKKLQFMSQQQSKLQNVYNYAVQTDFRQLVQVSILKDKINKGNVDMIMQTFKLSLIVLKSNQLRIYQNIHQDSSHRDIRVHQIQNVDYFSQPYIFTVMTIVKDKSTASQFLCFKFDCLEKQHKWDRAIYCNYIVRKMKHRSKYFLLEFPDKEGQKRNQQGMEHITKKRDLIKSYDIDRKRIIKGLQNQKEKSKEKQGTRMGTAGLDTQRDLPTVEKRDTKMQRFNTQHQNFIPPTKQNNYNMLSTKNADQKSNFDLGYKANKKNFNQISDTNKSKQQQQQMSNAPLTRNNTAVKPIPTLHKQSSTEQKPNQTQQKQNPTIPTTINPTTMTPLKQNKQFLLQQKQKQNKLQQQRKAINPYTKRKIQLKKIYQNGIKVMKIKFFADKPKLIYLGNQMFQYWDFDQATFHKSQKKVIMFRDIKIYKIVQDKIIYLYLELTNKNLQFAGKLEDLSCMVEWIQLPRKQRQFQQSPFTIRSKKQNQNQKTIFQA